MPFRKTDKGYYWGSKGPFDTLAKAQQIARAAYASGYKEESQMDQETVGEFIGTLLHSATITHFMHLQVTGEGSNAKHMALAAYYDGIVDLADGLAEVIQGCEREIIKSYPQSFSNAPMEPLAYMESLKQFIEINRESVSDESNVQNEIDTIVSLIDSTIYKLTFLR
jgi:DNA-binding ferritin-like protein